MISKQVAPSLHIRDETFRRLGLGALTGLFALLVLVVLYLSATAPEAVSLFPLGLAGFGIILVLIRHPLAHLAVILSGSLLIIERTDGVSVVEGFYGAYAALYLACWCCSRWLLTSHRASFLPEERALLTFLILAGLIAPYSLFLGAQPKHVAGELMALAFFAFFFPIKEACLRYRRGVACLLGFLACLCVVLAVKNLMLYRDGLLSTTAIDAMMGERITSGESFLCIGSLLFINLAVTVKRKSLLLPVLAGFSLTFAGLILSQSRGYWAAFALGACVTFWASPRAQRFRLVLLGVTGAGAMGLIAYLFFGDVLTTIINGLANRLFTFSGAMTKDVSLVNRFLETRGVLSKVVENPILGYGLGVPFSYYDILSGTTPNTTFMHNGYTALLYRFGIWGTGLVLFVYGASIVRGIRASRVHQPDMLLGVAGLTAASSLAAIALAGITSNPFHLKDTIFGLAFLMALAVGCEIRAKRAASGPSLEITQTLKLP